METQLITMLTNNDRTVENALSIFQECQDLSNKFWGFKNVGLPKKEMINLIETMKKADKKTFLEVVTYTEQECMNGAKLAAELGFDYLMGTLFYESVWDFAKKQQFTYLPFVGTVHSSPSILEGEVQAIIAEGKNLIAKGIQGFDLLGYRHVATPEKLIEEFIFSVQIPVVVAGSVSNTEKIDFIQRVGAWGYTIGGAFFDKMFVPNGTFKDNLQFVIDYMANLRRV